MSARSRGHVFLVGFMGSGKSTVGALLADTLGVPCVDLDALVEERRGGSVREIFERDGEAAFRQAEHEALEAVIDGPPAVVACGGGVVLSDENRSLLAGAGTVVYLRVSADEAIARIGDVTGRPLLAGAPGMAGALLRSRESLYEAVADLSVDTEGLTPAEVTARIAREMRAA